MQKMTKVKVLNLKIKNLINFVTRLTNKIKVIKTLKIAILTHPIVKTNKLILIKTMIQVKLKMIKIIGKFRLKIL